ncbi:MAG: sigma-70 family RNA polymerase sigma factor [Bacteroidota bacterium]
MQTQEVYQTYGNMLYFFILKKVKDKEVASDILQNSFLKIHKNLPQLKDAQKVRAWVYQIARNEVANYFDKEAHYASPNDIGVQTNETNMSNCCCFDRFIDELPKSHKEVIQLVYVKGEKQHQVAKSLGLSLPNVKAIIRKSKALLKEQFITCCNYTLNSKGKLVGEVDCAHCE